MVRLAERRAIRRSGGYPAGIGRGDTRSSAGYVEGCEAKLTMYPGAIEGFDRAIAADPGFALAHAARAHALLERGDAAAARASMAAANSLAAGLSAREASHIAFFDLLVAGNAEAALSALPAHLNAWPRDALVLGTTAFTNGLIGSSGRSGQKRALLGLLDRLAPSYGDDDWWFTAHRVHDAWYVDMASGEPFQFRSLPRKELNFSFQPQILNDLNALIRQIRQRIEAITKLGETIFAELFPLRGKS
jgi:hypothetical protein